MLINGIESEIIIHSLTVTLFLIKMPKHMSEKRHFLTNDIVGKLHFYVQKMKTEPSVSLYTQISSKWIKNLNPIPETLKLLEERM